MDVDPPTEPRRGKARSARAPHVAEGSQDSQEAFESQLKEIEGKETQIEGKETQPDTLDMAGVGTKIRTPCQCPSCDSSLQDDKTVIQHFRSKEHAQKMTESLERLGKTLPESILAELRSTILYVARTSEPEPIELDAFEFLRRANAAAPAPVTPSGPTSRTAQAETTKPHSTPQRTSSATATQSPAEHARIPRKRADEGEWTPGPAPKRTATESGFKEPQERTKQAGPAPRKVMFKPTAGEAREKLRASSGTTSHNESNRDEKLWLVDYDRAVYLLDYPEEFEIPIHCTLCGVTAQDTHTAASHLSGHKHKDRLSAEISKREAEEDREAGRRRATRADLPRLQGRGGQPNWHGPGRGERGRTSTIARHTPDTWPCANSQCKTRFNYHAEADRAICPNCGLDQSVRW